MSSHIRHILISDRCILGFVLKHRMGGVKLFVTLKHRRHEKQQRKLVSGLMMVFFHENWSDTGLSLIRGDVYSGLFSFLFTVITSCEFHPVSHCSCSVNSAQICVCLINQQSNNFDSVCVQYVLFYLHFTVAAPLFVLYDCNMYQHMVSH